MNSPLTSEGTQKNFTYGIGMMRIVHIACFVVIAYTPRALRPPRLHIASNWSVFSEYWVVVQLGLLYLETASSIPVYSGSLNSNVYTHDQPQYAESFFGRW
jgi:hypothetical protein